MVVYIDARKVRGGVEPICRTLQFAPATYYERKSRPPCARSLRDEQLKPALELQRKAQWRLDFIAAENSMGFHAPQEAARVLGEAADYARQGQIAAMNWREGGATQVAQKTEE